MHQIVEQLVQMSDGMRFIAHHLIKWSPSPTFTQQPGIKTRFAAMLDSEFQEMVDTSRRVKQKVDTDHLGEQLEMISNLPQDERVDAAAGLILAWCVHI